MFLDQAFVIAQFTLGNVLRAEGKTGEAHRHFKNAFELLKPQGRNDVLPESDGLTAGRLQELVISVLDEMGAKI